MTILELVLLLVLCLIFSSLLMAFGYLAEFKGPTWWGLVSSRVRAVFNLSSLTSRVRPAKTAEKSPPAITELRQPKKTVPQWIGVGSEHPSELNQIKETLRHDVLSGEGLLVRVACLLRSLRRRTIKGCKGRGPRGEKVGVVDLATHLGISPTELRDLEQGRRLASPDLIERIVEFCREQLGLTVSYETICGIGSRDFCYFAESVLGSSLPGVSDIGRRKLFRIYVEINRELSDKSGKKEADIGSESDDSKLNPDS